MWKMISTLITDESGEKVETFGISRGGTVVADISVHRAEIQEFTDLLNRLDASEIHAYELVEDFLGKY